MPHERTPIRLFGIVFVALLILVAVTVEAARHDLGRWNFAIAVLIAAIKACLIAFYFMDVRRSTQLVKLTIAAGLLWLAILFSLSLADYWTRGWPDSLSFPSAKESSSVIPISSGSVHS